MYPPAQQDAQSIAEDDGTDEGCADGSNEDAAGGDVEGGADEGAGVGMDRFGQLLDGRVEHLGRDDGCYAECEQAGLRQIHAKYDAGGDDEPGTDQVLRERLVESNSGKHSAEGVAKASGEAAEHGSGN